VQQPRARVTIRDVAVHAGVSVATVSKVINQRYGVAADTMARVQAVISELGYEASLVAQSLRNHRTNVIGILVADLEPFSTELLKGAADAIRGSGEEFRVFPHNHIAKLRRLLEEAPAGQLQVVVTESIFSMDGDEADLAALNDLKKQREFVLLLDEAHASGVYGQNGAGLAAERGFAPMVDIFMVSILVALVRFGAFVQIKADIGAIYFTGVVILTMLATECFDPRLMWDAAHAEGKAPHDR